MEEADDNAGCCRCMAVLHGEMLQGGSRNSAPKKSGDESAHWKLDVKCNKTTFKLGYLRKMV